MSWPLPAEKGYALLPNSQLNQPPLPSSSLTQQIALVSANNKAWKALDREKNKTIEVTSAIAACIASNRQLKEAKDAGKTVREGVVSSSGWIQASAGL